MMMMMMMMMIVSNAAWSVNDRSLSASLNKHFVPTVSVFVFVLYLYHLYQKRNKSVLQGRGMMVML